MTYDEIPQESHGSPVHETDAHLFRERWNEADPVRVWVSGTHVYDDNRSSYGFTLDSREELWRLIGALAAAYYRWPDDHR